LKKFQVSNIFQLSPKLNRELMSNQLTGTIPTILGSLLNLCCM